MRRDLVQTTLGVLFIVALIAASFWIMRPFLVAAHLGDDDRRRHLAADAADRARRCGRRRWLAVVAMTLRCCWCSWCRSGSPSARSSSTRTISGRWAKSLQDVTCRRRRTGSRALPLVGPKIARRGRESAAQAPEALAAKLPPYVGQALQWLAAEAGGFGLLSCSSC